MDIRNSNLYNFFSKISKTDKTFIIRFTIFFVIIGVVISLLVSPRFNSKISFYSKKIDQSTGMGFDLSQIMISGSPYTSNHDFNILDILSSNDIYEEMIYFNYQSIESNLVEFWNMDKESIFKLLENDNERTVTNLTVKKLKNRVSFKENRKSGLITIFVQFENKHLSKEFLEHFFQKISELLTRVNSNKYNEKVQFYVDLTDKYKSNLQMKEDELLEFITKNKNIQNSEILLVEKNRLERQLSIISNTYYSLLKDLEISKINRSDSVPLLVVLDEPKIAHKKSFPPRKIIVIIFGIFGVLISFFITIYKSKDLQNHKLFKSS